MTRILLVAPGAAWSTFDVYRGYLFAIKDDKELAVQGFNLHNIAMYHMAAMNEIYPHYSIEDRNAIITVRACRELLIDAIVYKPDIIFIVSATLIPSEVYAELLNIRYELDRPFVVAMYFTESPYTDEHQEIYSKYADILFVNDKYSVKRFDPKGNHYVEYLPHSFDPKVHRPGNDDDIDEEGYISDVFFGATAFRERLDLMANVNWNNVNLKMVGTWNEWANDPEYQKIKSYVQPDTTILSNTEYAKYYRNTKIALNVHRTRSDIEGINDELDNYSDAYSIGPRLYEAAACGAFILTDYRKEAEDLFGDTIEFFDGAKDLENKVHFWLDPINEELRQDKARAAREKVKDCTFNNRLEKNILPIFNEVLKLRRIKNG